MKYVFLALSWFFAAIVGLGTVALFLMRLWPQAIALLAITLVLLPPVRTLIQHSVGQPVPWWGWVVSIVVLLVLFQGLGSLNRPTSIYKSPQVEARLMEIYDEKMADWPVPYQDVFLDTTYGKVHVIVSGPEDAPPLLLLHASGVAGWSWKFNVEAFSDRYRIYAIDTLGDVGKSKLSDVGNYPQNSQQQGELYAEIADKLGVEKAYVVGASEGGFIGTNYALYAPERVEKLALLGPMGYAGTTESVVRIMLVTFFPLKPIRDSTIPWAFGDDPQVVDEFGEWFQLLMAGTTPSKARPVPFTAAQRQSLEVPVLLVLGEKDNLVGDPEVARALVQDIPDIRVEVLGTGHLIGAEQPEQVNKLILEFFEGR
jgi:pimeloyl-ACP methyl ester carboxylesterase